jgi:hypothetical protein
MIQVISIDTESVLSNFLGSFIEAAIGKIKQIPSKLNMTVPIKRGRDLV